MFSFIFFLVTSIVLVVLWIRHPHNTELALAGCLSAAILAFFTLMMLMGPAVSLFA